MTTRRVLVTGGAGFIGSHLARVLDEDAEVTVLDLSIKSANRLPTSVDTIEADIRDQEALKEAVAGVDTVFHQAALVSVSASIADPKESHSINATGTVNVLEAARAHDARVVVASSAAIYGHPERVPVDESHPLEPTSPYGIDKLATDHYARLYHDRYGLETVALRYFNVYGPGQTGGDYAGVIDIFFEQARDGGPITVDGDGKQTRDFVHVDDVVRANLLAADTDHVGTAYNIGTGESVTIRALAEQIRETVGSDAEIVHTDPREGDIRHSRADISRARERLGFETQVALADGLETLQ